MRGEIMIKIGNKLYELRKKASISQEEFADIIGTSRQAVSKWERDEAYPDIDKLILIAKYYNISVDYILNYETDELDVKKFISKLKEEINLGRYLIEYSEIEKWVYRYPNDYTLILNSSDYILKKGIVEKNNFLLEKTIDFINKLLVLDKNLNNYSNESLKKTIAQIYTLLKKPEEAKKYIIDNNLKNCGNILARCETMNKNYEKSLEILYEEYLFYLSELIFNVQTQIYNLVCLKKLEEAYNLTKWIINYINSLVMENNILSKANIINLITKVIIALLLNYDVKEEIQYIEKLLKNHNELDNTTKTFKNYYGLEEKLYVHTEHEESIIEILKRHIENIDKEEVEKILKLYEKYKELKLNDERTI